MLRTFRVCSISGGRYLSPKIFFFFLFPLVKLVGGNGIRTHDTIFLYVDLANQCLKPLSHTSKFFFMWIGDRFCFQLNKLVSLFFALPIVFLLYWEGSFLSSFRARNLMWPQAAWPRYEGHDEEEVGNGPRKHAIPVVRTRAALRGGTL